MKVIDGTIASPLGFSADGLHAGFKKRKMDFGWIVSEKASQCGRGLHDQ
ncbi:Glutamate N-acetyltransferase /N-acetylglutamate synthase [Streptococcus sp. HSISS2]|nr:Glutamate N-acetyltransferase /N-acetylglutamate synthase [Streptococcus sp. HSISS2]